MFLDGVLLQFRLINFFQWFATWGTLIPWAVFLNLFWFTATFPGCGTILRHPLLQLTSKFTSSDPHHPGWEPLSRDTPRYNSMDIFQIFKTKHTGWKTRVCNIRIDNNPIKCCLKDMLRTTDLYAERSQVIIEECAKKIGRLFFVRHNDLVEISSFDAAGKSVFLPRSGVAYFFP